MSNKYLYRELCAAVGDAVPLFQQAWWLDAVCAGKRWDVVLAFERDSNASVIAALPYLIGSKFGLRYVVQPQLTQFCGPWFRHGSEADGVEFEHSASQQLIAQLKRLRLVYFDQNFSPEITNWLPFHWAGYHETTRYTYRIDDIGDPERVFAAFHPSQRQQPIRAIEKRMHVVDKVAPADMAAFHAECLAAKGRKDLLPASLIERVVATSVKRGQGLTLAAVDEAGVRQGAIFVPYDSRVAYALLLSRRPKAHNGVIPLLIWEAIKRLSGRCKTFDFEGSMDPGIEHSYRLYGAHQVPYHRVVGILR